MLKYTKCSLKEISRAHKYPGKIMETLIEFAEDDSCEAICIDYKENGYATASSLQASITKSMRRVKYGLRSRKVGEKIYVYKDKEK